MGEPVRVLVVSPLPAVRAGLRALLAAADDVAIAGEAGHLETERLLDSAADVVVVDAATGLDPGATGDAAALGGPRAPAMVVLGRVADEARLAAAHAGRPWGYLPREASGEQLMAAVRAAAAGLVAIDAGLGDSLFARAAAADAAPPALDVTAAQGDDLTAREREVLQLVAQGLANKMIARRLGISEHTAKFHVAAILAKLGAGSRTEAVHLAARRGLVTL